MTTYRRGDCWSPRVRQDVRVYAPFASQLFSWHANSRERRVAALVLEVKGDFCHDIRRMLAELASVSIKAGVATIFVNKSSWRPGRGTCTSSNVIEWAPEGPS